MSSMSRGLGKGLDALFQNSASDAAPTRAAETPKEVPIGALSPNAQQPRRHFADAQLEELTASIRSQGILQPILVRSAVGAAGYEIIAGERRWRAAKAAGLSSVPVIIKEMSDQEVLIAALMENLQREDLTPMEEAAGLQQLKDEFGLSQEDLAARLGKSRSAIANTLRLLTLPETARQDLANGTISAGHARALLMITDPDAQERLREHMAVTHCTVREAERIAAHWKEHGELPEDLARMTLKKSAAPSGAAPKIDPPLAALQEQMSLALAVPVMIRGKEEKGKISLSYGSKEELAALLARLGIARVTTDV